ncbi:hypothetical protein LIER_31451 [Lithospermum erythrorhizon]|uniref:Uncharacterized protein n=1 Tax=Lithospermum erythrorhizon TaxID=34254 RepID=A0AAV3RS19_LITER
MTIVVPCIWTLKFEAKSLPPCTDADIVAANKICAALPQDTNTTRRLPWYSFVDEAMLVLAGLVHDKEFDPEAKDDPPTWGTNFDLFFLSLACFLTLSLSLLFRR